MKISYNGGVKDVAMSLYKRIKETLEHHQNDGRRASVQGSVSSRMIMMVAIPAAACFMMISFIATMDRSAFNNPGLHEARLAMTKDLVDNGRRQIDSNPWNRASLSDPKQLLLALFTGLDPQSRKALEATLDKLSPEQLQKLARLAYMIELDGSQKAGLMVLIQNILLRESPESILDSIGSSVEGIIAAVIRRSGTELTPEEMAFFVGGQWYGQLGSQAQQEAQSEQMQEVQEKVIEALKMITETEPDKIIEAYEAIAALPPQLQDTVTKVLAELAAADSEKLIAVLEDLNNGQINTVIGNLARLDNLPVKILVDRFDQASKSDVVKGSRIMGSISAPIVNDIVIITEPWSNSNFFGALNMISGFSTTTLTQFVGLGQRIGSDRFEKAYELIEPMGINTQRQAIGVLGNINSSHVTTFLEVSREINRADVFRDMVDVLFEVKNASIQGKAIEVLDNMDSNDLIEKAVDIFEKINTVAARQTIVLAHDHLDFKAQRQAIESLNRIIDKDGLQDETRIEALAQKLTDISDASVTQKVVKNVEPLSDFSLNQAVAVMIELDDDTTVKAVESFDRLDLNERTTAVDTMDEISTPHLRNAIEIVTVNDDKFLKDSVSYTDNLKFELTRDEAIATTERAINLASRAANNEERRRGLDGLIDQNAVVNRRILRQVDGQPNSYENHVVKGVAETYQELNDRDQDKFAKILSGSDGLSLGTKAGLGSSRVVTQTRKLFRTNQYYTEKDDDPKTFNQRLDFIKQRPVFVPQIEEQEFEVKSPVPVAGVRGKPGTKIKLRQVQEESE